MRAPKLVILSAPSGAGKTTLCSRLLEAIPGLVLSISHTSRSPRGEEKPGVHYHFVGRAEFESEIAQGRFAEWANVHGNYYGTSRSTIEAAFAAGRTPLLDIDVQGAASLRQAYPGQVFSVFVAPPSLEALERRLRARATESPAQLAARLAAAKGEMARSGEFDRVLVNDDLARAEEELIGLVRAAIETVG